MYDNSDIVLLVLIALLNFPFELNTAKRCWTQSFEMHTLCRSHQAEAGCRQCPGCSGHCSRDCPQGPAGWLSSHGAVLTLHWRVMSLSCGGS